MPSEPTVTQLRLDNIATWLNIAANTLGVLATSLRTPVLDPICNTTEALLKDLQASTIKQNKTLCAHLLEQTYKLLNAIMMAYIKSETGRELSPTVLNHVGKFTETLHKIHTFVEAQRSGSKVKKNFRQGEMNKLLKDCNLGLQQGIEFFQLETANLATEIRDMQEDGRKKHQEVLNMIEALSDSTGSDRASTISGVYSGSYNSCNSISMLPSEPKIFHGRESEMANTLKLFNEGPPRIAILGSGGMGKTSLARAILHHIEIAARYDQHRFFVACDSAANKVELAGIIGAHLGLKPGKDLTQQVVQYFSSNPPSLLILDNLETVWEPAESRSDIEKFLSLLTDADHLALMVGGAVLLLYFTDSKSDYNARSRKTREKDRHVSDEVDKILALTDHMPLAISLLAHLVDSEGWTNVLSWWDVEKTSLISDVEFVQSKLPIDDILGCRAALIRTALAYRDDHKRLKALVPIREYMYKMRPPQDHLIRPLFKYFQQLLELCERYQGTLMRVPAAAQIESNMANIQNVLQSGLHQDHPDLNASIYCTFHLNHFSRFIGRGSIPLMSQIHNILPEPCDHNLMVHFILELLSSWRHNPISNSESLVAQALEHSEQCGDPNLQCRLYVILGEYYRIYKHDLPSSIKFRKTAISLATSTGNSRVYHHALGHLAQLQWQLGDYSVALAHAYELQRLARVSADLHHEACALRIQALCWTRYGNYKQSISLCNKARDLLGLCGMSRSDTDHNIMASQAEAHKCKSEYLEARNIHIWILEDSPEDRAIMNHAGALLNIAEIDVFINAPYHNVQRSLQTARNMFHNLKWSRAVTICDATLADLDLREGNRFTAKTTFEKCMKFVGCNVIRAYCLECLGDISRWGAHDWMPSWTTVFLVHSLKSKEKLGIYKALRFLGDIFLAQNDEDTAISLFTLALQGFTSMDVHRSRAEWYNDLLQAVEHWEAARPLFERSSQAKQVELIDERLASVDGRVLEQHRKNLAHLAEIRAPSGAIEEMEEELSGIEDLEQRLNGVKGLDLVAT
ncbi:hypothetical protein DFH09DRAFT_1081917 [Mycena vulgaris]|nr:hypothetical protein DFH09DRAFT_1081917 [Mycena vulgaris]